jgi:pentatricopeptide repeat protein
MKKKPLAVTMENLDHFIGNPLFAIETNLDPLRKRIKEGRIEEALEILDEMQRSVDLAKEALSQVKA